MQILVSYSLPVKIEGEQYDQGIMYLEYVKVRGFYSVKRSICRGAAEQQVLECHVGEVRAKNNAIVRSFWSGQ